jgi:hypothetical protein
MSNDELHSRRGSSPVSRPPKSRHSQPKAVVLRTPEPVQGRVIARYVQGQSNRAIAAEECLDRSTVARILSQPEVARLMGEYQAQILGLVPLAIAAFEEVLISDNLPLKGATATKLLEGVGALLKNGSERLADNTATLEQEHRQQRWVMLGQMTEMMLAKNQKYGVPLPAGLDTMKA